MRWGIVFAGLSFASTVQAQGLASDVARAAELFDEGRRFVDAGDCTHAIASFRQSIQFNDSVGAHFNIANCSGSDPLLQWKELKAAELLARRKADRRADEASARAIALQPGLALVQAQAIGKGQLLVDSEPVDPVYLVEPIAVTPGPHAIDFISEGTRWHTVVTAIPRQTVSASAPVPKDPMPWPGPKDESASHLRATGILVGAVGVAGLAVGGVFGAIAATKIGDAKDACPGYPRCADAAHAHLADGLNDSGHSSATVATVALIAGGALVIGGAVLWLFGRTPAPTTARAFTYTF